MAIWIEPDWNVKIIQPKQIRGLHSIWIEPDWNVKFTIALPMRNFVWNLNRTRLECKETYVPLAAYITAHIWIEPDWNVKKIWYTQHCIYYGNLNRTRLECKDNSTKANTRFTFYLNRTRLECKVVLICTAGTAITIWIEPDWNVKQYQVQYFDNNM